MRPLLTLLALTFSLATAQTIGPFPVSRVIDGDTFVIDLLGIKESVRIIGIDTPEVRGAQPFHAEATAFARSRLDGSEVTLKLGVRHRDVYGRLLAHVATGDVDLALELAAAGLAVPLTVPPNIARAELYRAAAAGARSVGKGLWSGAVFEDRNCPHFITQREAQAFFKGASSPGRPDPHRLDNDKDGRVCMNLS